MQARQAELNESGWGTEAVPTLGVGIGLNTGTVIAGAIGGGGRLEYTVIGDAVNVAQRLQSEAESGEIVASVSTVAAAPDIVCESIGSRTGEGREPNPWRCSVSSVERANARWPWVVLAGFIGIAIVGMALVYANHESSGAQWPYVVAFTTFGLVGALIASRDRGNVIGFLLLYASFMAAASFASAELTTWLVRRGADGLGVQLLGLFNGIGWILGTIPAVFLLPLLFPDGHLPSRRWRPLLWAFVAAIVLTLFGYVLSARVLSGTDSNLTISNPFYVSAVARIVHRIPGALGIAIPLMILASVASVFVRFRHAHGIERQQIKWVLFGVVVAFVCVVPGNALIHGDVANAVVTAAGFMAIPVAVAVGVLRFHLYDLDLVVRKTVVYVALAVFATAVYLGAGGRAGRLDRSRELLPHDGGGGDRRRDLPADARAAVPRRQPSGVRPACDPLRDPVAVL